MKLDHFSYRCGVIDCFNEMVRAGLKPMALAHPCDTPAERDSYLPFCQEICGKYGTKYFPEDAMLLTDLFPLSANRGKYNIIFYRDETVRRTYEDLKAEKAALQAAGQYRGEPRRRLACRFGALLGYPEVDCLRMIGENTERESGDEN